MSTFAQRPLEYLDRGLVALETNGGIFLSWRMLGTDPADIGFNLYRNGELINDGPINETTNFVDQSGSVTDLYAVETIWTDQENEISAEVSVWPLQEASANPGKDPLPLKRIPLPTPPYKEDTDFTPGDMAVGDLNGDGKFDLIFEWESSAGYGSYLEAIDLDGNSFWRISLGPNTTTAKTNILVYDLNEDGKAEVTCLTGPGTMDGTGNYLSQGPAASADHSIIIERSSGNLMDDPQFITVFDGETGKEKATIEHWPPIGLRSEMNSTWGDTYGHRASSLKAAVLYTQENGPVLVYSRGIYTRVAMAGYTWDGSNNLSRIWKFDSYEAGNGAYTAQGNHSVGVGDVDGDGSDELMYGACAIDHDGTGLYSTGMGHGDSHHLADHVSSREGLEYFQTHENATYGISMRDAGTGEIIWDIKSSSDIGRGWAADVDPRYRGSECVGIGLGSYACLGWEIEPDYNAYDQPIYFDGDVERDLRNGGNINGGYSGGRLLTSWYYGASTIHYSKEDANLVADILGDWREEVIFRNGNNQELILFSTWLKTERKNYTLMHDPLYRMNIVVQNVGYNQPAHVGYYFADGFPTPDIRLIKNENFGTTSEKAVMQGIKVFPNPTSDLVNISIISNIDISGLKVEVFDIKGTTIFEDNMKHRTKTFSLNTLPQGIYFVRITENQKVIFTDKLLKR